MAIPPGYATAVWPGAGIAVAAVLVFGYNIWPGVLIGSIFSNFENSFDTTNAHFMLESIFLMITIGLGASMQALMGGILIRRFVGYPNSLVKERDLILFLTLAGPIGCLIGCSVGVSALLLYGKINPNQFAISMGTWWVGDTIGVLIFLPMTLIFLGEPKKQWRQKWRSTFLPLLSMFLFVMFLFVHARKWEEQRFNSEFAQQTDQFNQALLKNFDRYLEIGHALTAFYQSSDNVDRDEFKTFSHELLTRTPGVLALSWNPIVKKEDIAKYKKMAMDDGIQDFEIKELNIDKQLILSSHKQDHVIVFYLEPYDLNKKAIGFDIASTKERNEALIRAKATGKAAATEKVTLIQVVGKRQGLVVYYPVFKANIPIDTEEQRNENIRGYVAAGFEINRMLKEALHGISLGNIRLRIFDESSLENNQSIFDSDHDHSVDEDRIRITRNEIFDMAGRMWRIEFSISDASMFSYQPWVAWSVLAAGLLFTALLGAFLFTVASSEARSADLVAIRTAELHESRERFELAVSGSTDGLWDWNLVTNTLYISSRYKEMIGYQDHEFENSFENVTNQIHSEDTVSVFGALKKHIEEDVPFSVEFRMKMKSGEFKWILSRGKAIRDEHGKAIRMVGFNTDITERKEIEKMKSQFFDTISHELRTPLTPIHQFTTILQDGLGGPITDAQKEYLDIILKNTIQLQSIIGDLVDVSRISTGKLSTVKEVVSVPDLCSKIIQSFKFTAKGKDIQLMNMIPNQLPMIWVDPIRFEQVLRNLIDNAIKFTPLQGTVVVRATYPWTQENMVCFSVTDTGHGIEGDNKNRVFDRLYQVVNRAESSQKGLGLGLYICKEIVEKHDGQIWVESEVGKGSIFYFTIPVFSVANLIQPILKQTGNPPSQFGLISIQTGFKKHSSDSSKKNTLREFESYLETSIMHYDVLIPPVSLDKDRLFFYLIVLTDLNGVEAIKERLKRQWELKNKLGMVELELKFSSTIMNFQNKDFSQDEAMKMISSSVEHVINSQ